MMHKVIYLPNYGKVKCCLVTRANDAKAIPVLNYLGIPFAQPPVGNLRFLPPQRALPWSGVLAKRSQRRIPMQNVSTWEMALQYLPYKHAFTQRACDEDCLYLNVFVPEVQHNTKLPVMIWFYGGALQVGPNFFMDGTALAGMNQVIVVVPNYRINIFGFMALGLDSRCKGNMGLLDQRQAMVWVNENIEHFDGDKHNVTIFGESAGGISVNMHMISPLSKGLFHKAISHSGVATCTKMFVKDQERAMKEFLKILGIQDTNKDVVLEKLQSISAEKILQANETLLQARYTWLPTLDNHFFSDLPENLLSNSCKIPYMLGCNSDEGSWTMQLLTPGYKIGLSRDQFIFIASAILRWYDKNLNTKKALPILVEKYSRGIENGDKLFYSKILGNILADCIFLNHIVKVARKHADSGAPTYFYHMTHTSLFNHDIHFGPLSAHKPDYIRADHSDDIAFTFGAPFLPNGIKSGFKFSDEEKKLSDQMMTYFSNFAKNGNPNDGAPVDRIWPRYDLYQWRHMVLDTPLDEGSNFGVETLKLYTQQFPNL
uniref:Carboxylesterase 5A-like n=1 Tax=Phallusia mammillata TaxID=59560 RepID=A0A6F9D8E3_9ASCI|nr:carboxylesterase 5A-like [Phallusia mammillata]